MSRYRPVQDCASLYVQPLWQAYQYAECLYAFRAIGVYYTIK